MILFPFGRGQLSWTPPSDLDVTVVDQPEPPPLADPMAAIEAALDAPLDSPALETLARGARTATIVITDSTRPCPDHLLVEAIVGRLNNAGIPDDRITLLIAIGMHRGSTEAERIEKLGPELVRRCRVEDSAATDEALQVDFGVTPAGVPARVDRRAAEADLLISTGIVEPHQYAGFSGGWKTVGIGSAGAATISVLHGMAYLEHPRVRLAQTEENPFLEALRWIGEKAGLRFVVNVALDSEHRLVRVCAGHPESVHRELAAWVTARAIVPVGAPFPLVIGAAGHPKDSNLYQATRIPTYLCFGRRPVVEQGGIILVPAACPEDAGDGPGERKFFEWLSRSGGPEEVVRTAREKGYPAGGQRTVMVAWALMVARIAIVGARSPAVVRACGFESFETLEEAVAWGRAETGANRLLAVPRALTTLPEAGDPAPGLSPNRVGKSVD